MGMSDYEKHALREIHDWKNPSLTWWDQAMKTIQWPISKAGDFIVSTPGLGPAIVTAVKGLVSVANDTAQWTVRTDAIYDQFRKQGHGVRRSRDIFTLDLRAVDDAIGRLDAKYKSLALAEGAATGAGGGPGLVVDVPALLTLNLRAIGEYATYCGFEVSPQRERIFAMNVLAEASSPGDEAKVAAMAQLVRIARDVAQKKAWKDLEKSAFVVLMQRLARTLGVRLTKAKLAQVIPVAGAVVGGGFNAYFTARVCDTAYHLYRERFLAEKYGPETIEVSVAPAEEITADYREVHESLPGYDDRQEDPDL